MKMFYDQYTIRLKKKKKKNAYKYAYRYYKVPITFSIFFF